MMESMIIRNAKAWAYYRIASLVRSSDPTLSEYIKDLGKAAQANDAVFDLQLERRIKEWLKDTRNEML